MAKTVKVLRKVNARHMKPTQKHRLAIEPGILGTVYAYDDAGNRKYFDYDYDGALAYAGVTEDRDPRTWKSGRPPRTHCYIRRE